MNNEKQKYETPSFKELIIDSDDIVTTSNFIVDKTKEAEEDIADLFGLSAYKGKDF